VSFLDKRDQITRIAGMALYILAVLAVALLFNVWPEKIAWATRVQGVWTWTPLLSPTFGNFLPVLNLWWGLTILVLVVQLAYGRDTALMRWALLLLQGSGAGLIGLLSIRAPALFTPIAATWASRGLAVLCLSIGISTLGQLRHVLSLETVIFQWEDAEMDRI